jgi:hypothetical protein
MALEPNRGDRLDKHAPGRGRVAVRSAVLFEEQGTMTTDIDLDEQAFMLRHQGPPTDPAGYGCTDFKAAHNAVPSES